MSYTQYNTCIWHMWLKCMCAFVLLSRHLKAFESYSGMFFSTGKMLLVLVRLAGGSQFESCNCFSVLFLNVNLNLDVGAICESAVCIVWWAESTTGHVGDCVHPVQSAVQVIRALLIRGGEKWWPIIHSFTHDQTKDHHFQYEPMNEQTIINYATGIHNQTSTRVPNVWAQPADRQRTFMDLPTHFKQRTRHSTIEYA